MEADKKELYDDIIEAFISAIKKANADNSYSLSDMYVCFKYDDLSLSIYDDMERLLLQTTIDAWEPLKSESVDFNEVVISTLKDVLNSDIMKKEFDTVNFVGPFSVILIDEEYEQICELITIDKDNIFLSLKTTTVDQMSYMRDATINYELETLTGFGVKAMLRHRNDEPTGKLEYLRNDAAQTRVHDVTTSEASLTLRYAPGESFVNSKQRRVPVSLDAPIFTLTHAMGFKGVLGGDYNFNRTEASVWKRFWLPASWGKIDCSVKAGAEWNTVPFPLLILPEANLSYITQRETFNLINNMEFLNDRYASMSLSYDMNGKLFNRIPLIKNLKWREMFRVRALWGTLTDKNNPFKSNNPDLFRFPTRDGKFTSFVMDPKVPYVEASVGIYNIFKLLHVEYVHRFTYRDNPGINKNGIRFMVLMVF